LGFAAFREVIGKLTFCIAVDLHVDATLCPL